MKKIILCFAFIAGTSLNATELPSEPEMFQMKLPKIPLGKRLQLNYQMSLPKTQKMNQGASSFVAVYEKKDGKWSEVKRLPLGGLFTFSDRMAFSDLVTLKSKDSPVAVHSTVIHCGKTKNIGCYIQGFQSIIERDPNKSGAPQVSFHVEPRVN